MGGGYPVSPLMSSNNAETLLIAALGGMGIVLFPDWLIGDRLKSGELVGLLPELDTSIKTEPQRIAAIYPNARHPALNAGDYRLPGRDGSPLYWQSE
jgi:DNA-binding transcriptional LysR family regulator